MDKGQPLSKGMLGLGVFLFFGATMALLAGVTLAWPGTTLDHLWRLNPRAYLQLAPLGRPVGIAFLFLSTVMVIAGAGWFKQRIWGWWLAVGILATQCLGDLVNVFMGHPLEGLFGVTVAGALLFYLFRPGVRSVFRQRMQA
jgi:hypothetical protein